MISWRCRGCIVAVFWWYLDASLMDFGRYGYGIVVVSWRCRGGVVAVF